MDRTTGSLKFASVAGSYWASSAYLSELYAHYLNFNRDIVVPSDYNSRWLGFAVQQKTGLKFYPTRTS